MKWQVVDNRKDGQKRVITKFLWFPKRIGNEWRWFERATIKQTLHKMADPTSGSVWWEWWDREWIDSKSEIRFDNWEDAKPYLGKKIKVNPVESPSFVGILEGIHLVMNGTEVKTAVLEIEGGRWECWKCGPLT